MSYADKDKQKEVVGKWRKNNPQKCASYTKNWRKKNPEKAKTQWRRKHLREKYGISLEEYESMINAQNGLCGLCQKPLDNGCQIDVDHCHVTGTVRTVLHSKCNRLLSCANDDIDTLKKAILYLDSHGAGCKPLCGCLST
ncbi:MAG: endonuclease VII domain-containing protein [Desulfobacteraceae bacterium]|nr:endonuclease VII domain-containing protein [Desulfobacteraceae bacterium]